MSSSRKKKEEEEKRKREQEQGARRRQTNQSGTGGASGLAAVTRAVKEKQTQVNAKQAENRKSTDTRANSGGSVKKITDTVAQKAADAAVRASETQTGRTASQETRAAAKQAAKQAAETVVKRAETAKTSASAGRTGGSAAAKSTAQKIADRVAASTPGKNALDVEKRMQSSLDLARYLDDVETRIARKQSNILSGREIPGARTGAAKEILGTENFRPRWSPYAPDSMTHLSPSGLDQMARNLDLKAKEYGTGKDKVSMADILAATALAPLDAMRTDPGAHGAYGFGLHIPSKAWDSGLTDQEKVRAATERVKAWNREKVRQQSAEQQNLSRHDRKLRDQFQQEIRLAKADYDAAKAKGDPAGMQEAHKRAETWRRIEGGYSGGEGGMEHITPKLGQSDIAALNKTGQTRLSAAKLGYENAQTDQEKARYARMGQDIRRNPAYQKGEYDRGAYRATDAEGRMRYAGTEAERQKDKEQMSAILPAIGTGVAGSFLSIPGTTGRALQTDAARNQARLQNLSDIRGGGEVNIPEPERLRTGQEILAELRNSERYQNSSSALSKAKKLGRAMRDVKNEVPLGQQLLNRSDIYREKATEGQTGLNRYLTEALITGGEMIPGLAATALTGGMAAPGLAVMGTQAAGRRMGDLERQGEDPVRAFNRGVVTGLIEAATERVPLGNLTKIAKGGGGKSFVRNMLTQALEEVGTEELSELGGYAADKAFRDPNASLTAQDLKDTAVISLLTSLGMGTGAGIVGSRRTGQTGRQTATQTATGNEAARQAAEDSIRAREAQLQEREKSLRQQEQRALERMSQNTDSETYYNHFRNELQQVRREQGQIQQERLRLQETRRQAEASREEARTRQAEEERIAEESRYRPGRARDAGAELAAEQLDRVDRRAQAARDRAAREDTPVFAAMRDTLRGAAENRTEAERRTAPDLTPLEVPRARERQIPEAETARATSARYGQAENHIDNRASQDMGDRRVKAFQWDHPEVKPFFQRAAEDLKRQVEYADSTKTAQRASNIQRARGKKAGTVMEKNEPIRKLMNRGMSTTEIIKACDAIIQDQGQENYAAAKRVELVLDDMLSNGYMPVEASGWDDAALVSPNADYLRVKETLPGAVTRGSFEDYLRHNEIALELGEVTEEELRQEWEEARREREDRERLYRSAEDWSQNPRRYRTMEDELAAHAERVSAWMDEPQMQDMPEEYWSRYWQQAREEEQRIREKWAERENAPRQREYVDPETGELVRETRMPAAERTNGIKVYRGYNRSESPTERNLAGFRTADEVLGRPANRPEMLPLEYYTESPNDANNYATHDRTLLESVLIPQARQEYNRLVMEGRTPATDRDTWIRQRAEAAYSTLTGRDQAASGHVEEHTINPQKVLDLSRLGERASVDDIYRTISNSTGISENALDDALVLMDLGAETPQDLVEVFRVLRNEGTSGNVGSRFLKFLRDNGYDAVKYAESGTNHYAVFSEKTGTVQQDRTSETENLTKRENERQESGEAYRQDQEQAGTYDRTEDRTRRTRAEEAGEEDRRTEEDRYSVGAAPGGFDPYSRMANEYGTIEPGENPARMVDVPLSTNGEDRVRRGVRTIMEAQITPDEAVQAFEDEVVKGTFSYRPRKDKASVEAATKTLEEKGYWGAMDQWDDVVEGRRAAGKDDVVLAQFLYAEAARAKDIPTMRKLAAEIAAELTVGGQITQAARLLKKATPEGKVYYIHRIVSKMQAELDEGRGDKAPTLEIDPALEERLLDAEDEETQNEVIDEIYDQVAEQLPKTLGARLNAWRYFAMLGNPRTHIRNIVGNVLVQVPLQTGNKASALVQAATLPKEKRTRAFAASRAAKKFARADYQEMKDVLSNGDKYVSDESQIRRRQKLFPAPVQALMDANSKALEAEDTFFKKGTYIQDMASFITAKGWDAENLTESQLEQARSHAIKEALHATFQDSSDLAKFLSKTEKRGKAWSVAIGATIPFKSVPINIAKMGFELSPAGIGKAVYDGMTKVRSGQMEASEMIDELTRGMTGTAIAGLGYFLAAQGLLSAGAGDDEKENNFETAQGSQNYALDLGDLSYTLDWAAPSAIPLFLGAEFFNTYQNIRTGDGEEDESKRFKAGLDSLSRLFDPMLNMTVLSGLSDTLKTISYGSGNALFPLLSNTAQNYAGQFVPTLSGQIARTVDDTRRTTYADRNSKVPNSLQRFVQKQENKIPGLSQKNMPWLDVWGREDREENVFLRAFENFLSPGYISRKNTSEMEAELNRLHEEGFEGVLPSKAQTSTKVNDRYLTGEQYETLVRTQGGEARTMLEQVISSPEYKGLTDEEKAAYVKKIFDFSRQVGKLAVGMPEEKADKYVLKAREGQQTLGLDPAAYLALYVTKSLIDKDETEEDKTMKAIDFSLAVDSREDLTEEQKAFVKDNIKFFNMFPVSTTGFEKGLAAGLTAEESKDMLKLKKQADTDGNGSYTNAELYDVIQSTGKSEEEKAKLWDAMKPSNSSKSWNDLARENREAEATRKQWASSVGDVSQETINSFQESVNAIGGYNSMSYTAFFDLMDSMGVPESQRSGYYAIVQSNKAHPWKKTFAQAKKYKGR